MRHEIVVKCFEWVKKNGRPSKQNPSSVTLKQEFEIERTIEDLSSSLKANNPVRKPEDIFAFSISEAQLSFRVIRNGSTYVFSFTKTKGKAWDWEGSWYKINGTEDTIHEGTARCIVYSIPDAFFIPPIAPHSLP